MNGLIDRLPHRPPFRFVTELRCVDPSAFEAVWSVSGDEDFFRGHFPGEPIVPGVLITEALAQTAGLHLLSREGGGSHGGMLVQSEVRFRKPVHPPAMISLRVIWVIGRLATLAKQLAIATDGNPLARALAYPAVLALGSMGIWAPRVEDPSSAWLLVARRSGA
jgi:3-hydroxyacyl-[acyl-carrier-protein] dehydratase